MAATDDVKIVVNGNSEKYAFLIKDSCNFTMSELGQAFAGATSLAYSDDRDSSERIIITAQNGIFKEPEGGWSKEGRKYFVVEGKVTESGRDKQIKSIMQKIREQKKKPGAESQKGSNSSTNYSRDTLTRSRNPKVRIGWRHFKNDCYKQVFLKDGGGVRDVPLSTLDIDVDTLIQLGTDVFFREGKCKYGEVDDMETCLGDFSGQRLVTFEARKDERPCLGNYLRAHGLHLSKCTFYIMTRRKETISVSSSLPIQDISYNTKDSENAGIITEQPNTSGFNPQVTPIPIVDAVPDTDQSIMKFDNTYLVPVGPSGKVCERQSINVQYQRDQVSSYSNEVTMVTCHSIEQCKDFSSGDAPHDDDEPYNPCLNGFSIGRIDIGGKCFMETYFEYCAEVGGLTKQCRFPSSDSNEGGIINHHPLEIWGYDGDNFVLGTVVGPAENVRYEWFKDNIPITSVSSTYACIIIVKDPGMYTCQVTYADIKQMSKPIQIISINEAAFKGKAIQGNCNRASASTSASATGTSSSTSTGIVSDKYDSNAGKLVEPCSHGGGQMSDEGEGHPCFAVPEVATKDLNIDYSTALGTGSFGTVYKGNWAGSDVAVKAVTINKRTKKTMVQMVEKEIRISSKIRHPNIVQFLAVARAPTSVYLVHEFIDGCNMEDAIFDQETKQGMAIAPTNKLFIVRQCLQGVAYLHALVPPVIHQDIKPSNILIKRGCFTTKLCDLGVSRIKSVAAATTTLMGTGCGSPAYMAPECLIHNAKGSMASDIWSLGISLIEFATEEDAWSVDGEMDQVAAIIAKMNRRESPVRGRSVLGLPTEIIDYLEKCVDYVNKSRPNAEEILKYLSQY